jgi:hypothetical protein
MLAAAKQENSMDPKLAAIMAILSSVSDPAAAIEAIKSLVANLDDGAAVDADADPMPETADAPPPEEGTPAAAAAPDGPDADKDKVAAAAPAKPAPAKVTPAAPARVAVVDVSPVKAAAEAAVLQIENAQRDHMIATQGDRLDPSIRTWASSQPYAVVKGLIAAAPAKQTPTERVAATRGAGHVDRVTPKGLEGEDLEKVQKAMGTFKASASEPHEAEGGRVLVLPTVSPRVLRERKLSAASAATAGKAGV